MYFKIIINFLEIVFIYNSYYNTIKDLQNLKNLKNKVTINI